MNGNSNNGQVKFVRSTGDYKSLYGVSIFLIWLMSGASLILLSFLLNTLLLNSCYYPVNATAFRFAKRQIRVMHIKWQTRALLICIFVTCLLFDCEFARVASIINTNGPCFNKITKSNSKLTKLQTKLNSYLFWKLFIWIDIFCT